MRKEKIEYYCDICKKEINIEDCIEVVYPVIYQPANDSPPFIEQKKIELCRHCGEKVLKLTAYEDQGYSEYEIIEHESKQSKRSKL